MNKIIFLIVAALIPASLSAQSAEKSSLFELRQRISSVEFKLNEQDNQIVIKDEVAGRKNRGLAILYSLLLPGMGELYAGSYQTGKYFTIAEAALWGFYAGFNIYGNWQKDNYKSFAVTHGGIDPSVTGNGTFMADLGDFNSVEDFNVNKGLEQSFDEYYDTEKYYWKWDNSTQRKEYRNMWVSSEMAFNNVRFAVGAMVVNRIISAINAARIVSRHNRGLQDEDKSLRMSFTGGTGLSPVSAPSDFSLVLVKPL